MTAAGYAVHTACGAAEALAHLHSFTPDAVLMDIRLPGMNGLALTRLIKLTRGPKQASVVAVSASQTAYMIQAAYDAGCDGYITKPIDPRTFAGEVRHCLGHN
jgi:two-component system, cell cycle response regulator DivK